MLRRLARIWKIPVWMFWDLCSNPVWYSGQCGQGTKELHHFGPRQWINDGWIMTDPCYDGCVINDLHGKKTKSGDIFLALIHGTPTSSLQPLRRVWECRWCGFSVGWKLQCRSAELTVPKKGPLEKIRYEMYHWNHQNWSGKLTKRKLA